MENVLITGGSGMVGKRLTEILLKVGYSVSHLSRNPGNKEGITIYKWDLKQQFIDPEAIDKADFIIHLAGAGVADKRWTAARKKEIVDSRVDSGNLIFNHLKNNKNKVKAVISASGMGIYGDGGNKLLTENDPAGTDFLAQVCVKWEKAINQIQELDIRTVNLRIGLVLTTEGGALPKLALPVKMAIGNYFGDGSMIYSWIHIDDLCKMFLFCLKNEALSGPYNAVSEENVSNKNFIKILADALNRPFIPVPVPEFALKLALGEMSAAILTSANVSSQKIKNAGFTFDFPNLKGALEEIYG